MGRKQSNGHRHKPTERPAIMCGPLVVASPYDSPWVQLTTEQGWMVPHESSQPSQQGMEVRILLRAPFYITELVSNRVSYRVQED